ncbi:L-rhamnose mutarotase [Maritalea mobilis]|uniref:L-rhamnose mutarotase n=1 Tax=Maritalea mobilis TaxID=483324 RepID=A0A4V3DAH1_9HYPH|nr:L-rhamnose mutarotase [Maritalea mobilis]TDQ62070.1 L-rhamnose mutarotase [Maritalea mobilis]
MERMGMVIGVWPEFIARYKELHADVWPEILQSLSDCNVTNYSIFLREPENLLFGYWEYVGSDFAADMKKMADMPITQEWWELCIPCQKPLESKQEDEWWASMEQVFYHP